jgi:hypothetical protein
MQIADLARRVGLFAQKYSPEILTGVAVAGTVATMILTGKAAYKAAHILREAAIEKAGGGDLFPEDVAEVLTPKEKVELTYKLFIPPIGIAALTIGAIICARHIDQRRAAVVAAMYALSERTLTEYRDKVTETIGERKETGIRTALGQDKYDRNPNTGANVIVLSTGNHLAYEDFTGREFTSNWETIKSAERTINERLQETDWQSLDDFYDILGLPHTTTSSEIGWTPENRMRMHIDTILSKEKVPCIYFEYTNLPVSRYPAKPQPFRG